MNWHKEVIISTVDICADLYTLVLDNNTNEKVIRRFNKGKIVGDDRLPDLGLGTLVCQPMGEGSTPSTPYNVFNFARTTDKKCKILPLASLLTRDKIYKK